VRRPVRQLHTVCVEKGAWADEQGVGSIVHKSREGCVDLAAGVGMEHAHLQAHRTRCPFHVSHRGLARQLLASLPKQDEWLFPGRLGQHRTNLDHSWRLICRAAGITGLRIHDLRHSYASTLVGAGFSLPTFGALLGHSQPQTTARYAHLLDDPLRLFAYFFAGRIGKASTCSTVTVIGCGCIVCDAGSTCLWRCCTGENLRALVTAASVVHRRNLRPLALWPRWQCTIR